MVRWRWESLGYGLPDDGHCSLATRRASSELSGLGMCRIRRRRRLRAAARFQKRKRWVRVWSRRRLRAIRMSQVAMEQSSRKEARESQARRRCPG